MQCAGYKQQTEQRRCSNATTETREDGEEHNKGKDGGRKLEHVQGRQEKAGEMGEAVHAKSWTMAMISWEMYGTGNE